MDADAITIKNRAIIVICRLSNFPIISVGLVKILSKSENFWFKKISEPVTIKTEKKENIIKFIIKLKLPFLKSLSFFTYLEKSPKLIIKIEKYANIAPATVNKGAKLFISKKLSKFIIFEKAEAVIFTSLKKTTKKKKIIPT